MEPEHNIEIKTPSTEGHGAEIFAILFAIALCAIISTAFGFWNKPISDGLNSVLTVVDKTEQKPAISPFATAVIQARAAYVFDIRNQKVIFAKNAEQPMPLASLTKIMTAEVAMELLSPNATVTIDQKAIDQDGNSGLTINEQWNFKKLLDYTLAVSSNDGASAIASAASPNFVEKMNEKAAAIGLLSMRFYNETGLDISPIQSGANGSATDVAKLFAYVLQSHPDIFTATRSTRFTVSSLDNINHVAVNTDSEINKIPGIIGSKTGFTDLAGGNLAVIYDASVNYPIVVVVLGSTYDGRFSDMNTLIEASNKAISLQNSPAGL